MFYKESDVEHSLQQIKQLQEVRNHTNYYRIKKNADVTTDSGKKSGGSGVTSNSKWCITIWSRLSTTVTMMLLV